MPDETETPKATTPLKSPKLKRAWKRVDINAPFILIYTAVCLIVLALRSITGGSSDVFFSVGGSMDWTVPLSYFRMVSHILGHYDLAHFANNFMLILLIGPLVEEKYGTKALLFMVAMTAVVTGFVHILFADDVRLMGASGIAFMLIVLGSLTNRRSGKIPVTFILVAILFVGREVFRSVGADNVSQMAHIVGGACGAFFGFLLDKKK